MTVSEPCGPWPVDPECCPALAGDPSTWTPRQLAAIQAATNVLWRATAGIYGLCEMTLRPCMDACDKRWDMEYALWRPWIDEFGVWRNAMCGCSTDCSCGFVCTASLKGPVYEIISVSLNGVVLEPAEYKLVGHNMDKVARRKSCWPSCQDQLAEADQPNTFQVTYLQGTPVPVDGILAVTALACYYMKWCDAAGNCTAPGGWTSISRDGITIQRSNDPRNPRYGVTGVTLVDDWVASVNPYGVTERASVWSPDFPMSTVWSRRNPV